MTLTNFTAADFAKDGIKRADSTKSRRVRADQQEAPTPTAKPIDKSVKDENEVPSGTVPEILSWVGEDKEKAQKALDVEQKDTKPRKGLVTALTELLEDEDDEPAETTEPVNADDAEKPDEDEILSSDDSND